MEAYLAREDVVAILPTGAGKSLCFQLPAVAREGLTLVISPLIALMKDQVDALTASGVPATFLNSSLSSDDNATRRRGLAEGAYKLLYAAPERIMSPGFIDDLRRWQVAAMAVDEAHCISEWGHDFRPEYRQLATLRAHLPEIPCLALTATATAQVRADIIRQLQMQQPRVFQASFNRPNLTYAVVPRKSAGRQVLDYATAHPDASGIVYVRSRKNAETIATALRAGGVDALPYHAGLARDDRAANQDAFIRDEVRVICATIAFGMGINKPDVRFVIHADLPKNIEGYYQETGRAGRDGLHAECLLLLSHGDVVQNLRFVNEVTDEHAAAVARRQIQEMADFAETSECRRAALLGYFGETWPEDGCGACDNCLSPRETWDATTETQKLLSCIYRVRQKSGFDMGLKHVVEVIAGAKTEKLRTLGHDELSTHGIGADTARETWMALGRQLIRAGYINVSPDAYQTVSISAVGAEALKNRSPVVLTRPVAVATSTESRSRAGEFACDEGLFSELRVLRKALADSAGVPPYVVFGDNSLRHMARAYPTTGSEFLRIPGVGAKKLATYGDVFIQAIQTWLSAHEPMPFEVSEAPPTRATVVTAPKSTTPGESALETVALFVGGMTPEDIARTRSLKDTTVHQHLCAAIAAGELESDPRAWYSAEDEAILREAVAEHGLGRLAPLRDAVEGRLDYTNLHYFRAFEQRRRG